MICTVGSIYWAQKKKTTNWFGVFFSFFSYLNDMKTENVCWLPRQMLIIRSTFFRLDSIVNMIFFLYVKYEAFACTLNGLSTWSVIFGIHRSDRLKSVLFFLCLSNEEGKSGYCVCAFRFSNAFKQSCPLSAHICICVCIPKHRSSICIAACEI